VSEVWNGNSFDAINFLVEEFVGGVNLRCIIPISFLIYIKRMPSIYQLWGML